MSIDIRDIARLERYPLEEGTTKSNGRAGECDNANFIARILRYRISQDSERSTNSNALSCNYCAGLMWPVAVALHNVEDSPTHEIINIKQSLIQ